MDWPFLITLFLIGLSGSYISAMTELGGAIIIVPALLYIPPLVGVGTLWLKSHRVPVKLLRRFLAIIISYAAIRMIYDVLK